MDKALIAFLVGVVCAVAFGYYVARRSSDRQKIRDGLAAQVFHFIGAAGIAGILPAVLASLLLGQGFRTAFPLALAFLVTGWLALLIYAALERPARTRASVDEGGWTQDDARKSI